jgi:hypothetical protein
MIKIYNKIKGNSFIRGFIIRFFFPSSSKVIFDTYSKLWKFEKVSIQRKLFNSQVYITKFRNYTGYRESIAFNDHYLFCFLEPSINTLTGLINLDFKTFFWDCGTRSLDGLSIIPLRKKRLNGISFVSIERNFYHFIVDELSIIIEAHKYDINFSVYMPVYVRWKVELLNIFCPGIDIKFGNGFLYLKCDTLLASIRDITGYVHPGIIDTLRYNYLKIDNTKSLFQSTKIYISRSKAPSRRIMNEAKLVIELNNLGFIAICLEDLTLIDQINLFNSATIIIAPHGAGLANMMGMNSKSTLIELIDRNHFSYCYTFIADYIGLNYFQFDLINIRGNVNIDVTSFLEFFHNNKVVS